VRGIVEHCLLICDGKGWIYKLTIWTPLLVKQDLLRTSDIGDNGDIECEIRIDAGYSEVGFPRTMYTKAGGGVTTHCHETPLLLVQKPSCSVRSHVNGGISLRPSCAHHSRH
jgi:hypothetical protein